jgi:phosphoglycerate kinase
VAALPRMNEYRAAGLLIEKEIQNLGQLLTEPERPYVAILGGSKVSTKIGAFDSLIMKADTILIGGAMAYTFLKAQGVSVGASRVENGKLTIARRALLKATSRGVNVCLPTDHVIVKEVSAEAEATVHLSDAIPSDGIAVDIGPDTAAHYAGIISKARTVFWNGPMGIFELEPFASGTRKVAEAVAYASARTVVGGGDSLLALKQSGFLPFISHVSTGGGASLVFIEGKELPGLEALRVPILEL